MMPWLIVVIIDIFIALIFFFVGFLAGFETGWKEERASLLKQYDKYQYQYEYYEDGRHKPNRY